MPISHDMRSKYV